MPDEQKVYALHGPLFFASTTRFASLFTPESDPVQVTIDFRHAHVYDHSALDSIARLSEEYQKYGKTLHLANLRDACHTLVTRGQSLLGDVTLNRD